MIEESAFIDLEVVRGRLQSVVDEAGVVLTRTAFSHIVREGKDFACAVLTIDGGTVVQSAQSIPVFLGTMTHTAKELLRRFPVAGWRDGDVIGTNDPWLGTGHLYDLTVLTPVFLGGNPVAFAGVVAHLPDVGGRGPAIDSTEVFEEGLRIPPVRLATAHGLDSVVAEFLAANVRLPDQVLGDVHAILNAAAVISTRLAKLCAEITVPRFHQTCLELERRTESYMRRAVMTIPDGVVFAALSSEGIAGNPFTIKLQLSKRGDAIALDFGGSTAQLPAAINSSYTYTRSYAVFALKCALAPAVPFNEGFLRPIRVDAPEGSVVNSRFPAAGAARNLVGHFVPTLVLNALAELAPDKSLAESGAPRPSCRVNGSRADGKMFTATLLVMAGLGAGANKDGASCLAFPTNTEAVPVEMLEASCPVRFEEKEFAAGSGGPGEFRGGLGQRMTIRSLAPHAQAFLSAQRLRYPPRGMRGGEDGMPAMVLVDGVPLATLSGPISLPTGAVLTIQSAGGGGFGDPRRRDPAKLEEEIRNGYVPVQQARACYGRNQ